MRIGSNDVHSLATILKRESDRYMWNDIHVLGGLMATKKYDEVTKDRNEGYISTYPWSCYPIQA